MLIHSISVICMQNKIIRWSDKIFHKVTFSTMLVIYYWSTFGCFWMSGESRARKLYDWRIILIMSWPQLLRHYRYSTINCNLWSSGLQFSSVILYSTVFTCPHPVHISNRLSRCIIVNAVKLTSLSLNRFIYIWSSFDVRKSVCWSVSYGIGLGIWPVIWWGVFFFARIIL